MKLPCIALASMKNAPESAALETGLLREALFHRGFELQQVPWDARVDWGDYALTVIRSTWDYHHRRDEFLEWAQTVPRLFNPARVLAWSSHKTYLRDLEKLGVPTVPTAWVPHQTSLSLKDVLDEYGWEEAVLKPAVSAGAEQTMRFTRESLLTAQSLLATICSRTDAMIQPYLRSVETSLERSLIFLDGAFSHAVKREPILQTRRYVAFRTVAADDEKWVATQALQAVRDADLLYARVDLVRDDEGEVKLLEFELLEPYLYLPECPEGTQRLVEGIVRRVLAVEGT